MMTPPKKGPKPASFTVLQAEFTNELSGLIREMMREQAILVSETMSAIQQLRELHAYVMQVRESESDNACNERAKIIPFPAPPRVTRVS
jgi:hypothetical protein